MIKVEVRTLGGDATQVEVARALPVSIAKESREYPPGFAAWYELEGGLTGPRRATLN
jgi:hypothetical protein